MALFDAGAVVEPLDWDFRKIIGPSDLNKGTIEEPNDKIIAKFQRENAEQMEKARKAMPDIDPETATPDEILAASKAVDDEEMEAMMRRQAEIYSRLCRGKPTVAQILKLPPRIRLHFYAWLLREVMNPEAVTGAGNGQVVALRPVAG